jgi:MFS transporter, UMF1 family
MHASKTQLFGWALYDWGNSAFAAIIQTFVFAAYFTRSVAATEVHGTALWGTTISIAALIVAAGGPLLGAIADQTGRRKPWIAAFSALAIVATGLLWFVKPSPEFTSIGLLLVGLGTVGTEFAVIFYNAMLPDLAPAERIGRWSGWGWGLGYAGGLASLTVALVLFIGRNSFALDASAAEPVRATFVLTAVWFFLFSVPLLIITPDEPATGKSFAMAAREGLGQVRDSIRQVRRYSHLIHFLIAKMIYIDALSTIFALGGVFAASTFDMSEQQVLLFGIGLNIAGGIGAAAFGWVDDRVGSKKTVAIALVGLIIPATLMLIVRSVQTFWILAMILGLFVGPLQTASRSYMARAAPDHLRNQMFGLFALSGKATAFVGPLVVGWITAWTGSQRIGMSTVVVLLVIGFILLQRVPEAPRARY